MINLIENSIDNCSLLVIGDVMLDQYFFGEVSRISPEAPVPINHVNKTKSTLGGASNVAHNLALLGAKTSIAGFIGNDHHGQTLIDLLNSRNIDCNCLIQTDKPTTAKIRVIGGHQQMLRLDFEDSSPFKADDSDKLFQSISDFIDHSKPQAVIISDYGKGTCSTQTCQAIINLCRSNNIIVLVDPKGNDWFKYSNADFITPNLKELNQVLDSYVSNDDSQIELASQAVTQKFNIKNIIVTRSDKGLTLFHDNNFHHIKARAQEVFDVSGAGDTVIATFALALCAGMSPKNSAFLANLAASVVVGKVGTYAISRDELLKALN